MHPIISYLLSINFPFLIAGKGEPGPTFNHNQRDTIKMFLSLSGTCGLATGAKQEVFPTSPDENMLSLVQRLIATCDVPTKHARSRKAWDCTFTLKYGDGGSGHQLAAANPSAAATADATAALFPCCFSTEPALISDTLNLLKTLREIAAVLRKEATADVNLAEFPAPSFTVDPMEFHSPKISTKLLTQLDDVVAVAAYPTTLPAWCTAVMTDYPVVIPYNTRHYAFSCTAFGPER